MTAQEAWLTLKEYVRRNHGDEQELIQVLKELEIKGSDLANPEVFETAYTVAYNLSREGKDRFGQLPAELDGIPIAAQTPNTPAPVKPMETPVEQAPKAEPVKAEQPRQTPKAESLKADQPTQMSEAGPAKAEQTTHTPNTEPAKVEQPIQAPKAEPMKTEQPKQKPVATAPTAPAPINGNNGNGNGSGSKPKAATALVADLEWKPRSWDEITDAVARLGYDLQDVIALLSKTYGPGTFDIKKLQDYWLLTAHNINEGNIRKLG
jgi:DNA polymerase III gamma/tau subunit